MWTFIVNLFYDISDRFVILDRGEVIHKLDKQDVVSAENLMKIIKVIDFFHQTYYAVNFE